MSRLHDVVVIGAGPAGCAAAATLARAGAGVLVLDRADFPRDKLCGGLLTEKTVRVLKDVFGLNETRLTADGIIRNTANRYEVRIRERLRFAGFSERPFRFVKRREFDARLLDRVRELGAEVRTGTAVTGCDPEAGTIALAHGTTGETVRARILIGADGVNSRLQALVLREKADQTRWKRFLAPAIEIELPPEAFPSPPPDYPALYGGFVKSGYAWLFPGAGSGGKLVAGVCALPLPDLDIKASFLAFLRTLGIAEDAIPPLKGHPLPYGNFLADPTRARLLLAGDAGGFAEPLLGEGIFQALETGRMAARAALDGCLDPARAAAIYAHRLNRDFLPDLRWTGRLRDLVFACLDREQSGPVHAVMSLFERQLLDRLHGARPWSPF